MIAGDGNRWTSAPNSNLGRSRSSEWAIDRALGRAAMLICDEPNSLWMPRRANRDGAAPRTAVEAGSSCDCGTHDSRIFHFADAHCLLEDGRAGASRNNRGRCESCPCKRDRTREDALGIAKKICCCAVAIAGAAYEIH